MKTSQKMFLRRHGKRGHEELLVHVEWDGVTDQDIKLMACHYILTRVRGEMQGEQHVLPEAVTVYAADYIHNEPLVQAELKIPAKWKEPPKSKARKEIDKLFEGLSREEILTLLGK